MVPVLDWSDWRYAIVKGPAFHGLNARMKHCAHLQPVPPAPS
jgi:hypothetical protein